MSISATDVKNLRERSGAGMMDAKKALVENDGNMEAALDWLRQKGIAKAAKKAGRTAAEGLVAAKSTGSAGAIVEVNSETDFVAKNDKFQAFVSELVDHVAANSFSSNEDVANSEMGGKPVTERVTDLVATIGENIQFRRATTLSTDNGVVADYIHMGGKIGVLVAIEGASGDAIQTVARQVAMHVAASNPAALNRDAIDAELVAREKAVYVEQARESGKPEQIIEKMVEGRLNKFFQEQCLVEQAFVMDTDKTVADVVKAVDSDASITGYIRFQLGEGIEREESDFAAEVAAAASAA